jgi:RNA polymerase sigma-70 factor (ECF subfamily)
VRVAEEQQGPLVYRHCPPWREYTPGKSEEHPRCLPGMKGLRGARRLQCNELSESLDQLMTCAPSFDEIVAEHLTMIRRISTAYEADPAAREDLVQDILCAVWRALPRFRGEGGLRGFIARIATNRAVTHVQRALRVPGATGLTNDLPASECGPEAHAIASDDKDRFSRALRALPIGLKEPALLALEGLTQQEIGGALGISANAVAIRMTRAKSQLRKLLGE